MPFLAPFGFGQSDEFLVTGQALDPDSGNYFQAGATRWGPSGSSEFSAVVWFKINHTQGAPVPLLSENQVTTIDKVRISTDTWKASPTGTDCKMNYLLRNNAGSALFNMTSDPFSVHDFASFEWVPMFFSARLSGTPVVRTYLGNTDVYGTPSNGPTAGTIDLNDGVAPQIGINSSGSNGAIDISTTWIDDSYIDFSVQANRDKFMDENLRPKNLGDRGQNPTGSIPLHFNPHGDLTDNKGTEANWTEVGTVSQATTSPTDPAYYYDDMAGAEGTSDVWEDGDVIDINGVHFVYISELDVDGHSGLIHRDPFNENGKLTAGAIIDSEDGSDPDTWTGFTDASTGVKSTDYEFDTDAGAARFRNLTGSGQFFYGMDALPSSGETEAFTIYNDIQASADSGVAVLVESAAYDNGTNYLRSTLQAEPAVDATNWLHLDGTLQNDTGIAFGTAKRLWVYTKSGKIAVWLDDGTSPAYSDTTVRSISNNAYGVRFNATALGLNALCKVGYHLHGSMTIA